MLEVDTGLALSTTGRYGSIREIGDSGEVNSMTTAAFGAALKRKEEISCLVGYSGKILNIKHLSKNIVSRPEVYLMHGDIDAVVPLNFLLEAKEFFAKQDYKINTKIFNNCEHRIPTEGSSIGLEFLKKNLYK